MTHVWMALLSYAVGVLFSLAVLFHVARPEPVNPCAKMCEESKAR